MAELELEQKRFLLLYGSQTGQAKAIAEIIAEQSVKKGYNPEMFCLSCLKKVELNGFCVILHLALSLSLSLCLSMYSSISRRRL